MRNDVLSDMWCLDLGRAVDVGRGDSFVGHGILKLYNFLETMSIAKHDSPRAVDFDRILTVAEVLDDFTGTVEFERLGAGEILYSDNIAYLERLEVSLVGVIFLLWLSRSPLSETSLQILQK